MPHELALGYFGRIARWNGISTRDEFVIRASQRSNDEVSKSINDIMRLAALMRYTPQKFVCEHTLIPFAHAFDGHRADGEHGSEERRDCLENAAFRIPRPRAQLCAQCVEEDLDFHGFSWWRRYHQLPGVIWCERHRCALGSVDRRHIFKCLPEDLVEQASMQVDAAWIEHLLADPVLDRFRAIQETLLGWKRPLQEVAVSRRLRDRAALRGFHSGRGAITKPLVSSYIWSVVDRAWLAQQFNGWSGADNQWFAPIDGAVMGHPRMVAVSTFALVTAALWEDLDDGLNALLEAEKVDRPRASRPRDVPIADPQDLERAYVACEGRHHAVANRLNLPKASIATALRGLGLPALGVAIPAALITAAHLFLNENMSIEDAASSAGVRVSEVENLVRRASGAFASCIRRLTLPANG